MSAAPLFRSTRHEYLSQAFPPDDMQQRMREASAAADAPDVFAPIHRVKPVRRPAPTMKKPKANRLLIAFAAVYLCAAAAVVGFNVWRHFNS